jgi:polysaccharide pyruvyl transferase WcaK-like protein
LDPTLLLDITDYETLMSNSRSSVVKNELLIYILDQTAEKENIIELASNKLGMKPFKINHLKNNPEILPPVEGWLMAFRDASFIITDSYHGCIFSILFNKPFLVIANKERGLMRFTSILTLFGLEKRMIHSIDEFSSGILENQINWEYTNSLLEKQRKYSRSFLINALKGINGN